MRKIRVIVIDDENAARMEIKRALIPYPEIEVVAEAANADEAREKIKELGPDLIFLDIQMPEESGFDLLTSLMKVPAVIFTTAFDQYAVQAFEINALDYLMKPIRDERFAQAIERFMKTFREADRTIFIKDGERCHFVKMKTVYLIESMDNYARLYFGDQKAFLKTSLNQFQENLDENVFFRINRAQIINLNYIDEIIPMPKGRLCIRLTAYDELLDLSERQSVKFKQMKGI